MHGNVALITYNKCQGVKALIGNFTNNGLSSFSHVISGGGTASDLHSRVTCLFFREVILWMPLMPAILGGTKKEMQH